MENAIDDLQRKVWITKGSRFEAQRRLEKLSDISGYAINIPSLIIIIISIVAIKPPKSLDFLSQSIGSILTLTLSISILVISILLSAKEYKLKAEKMHDCGRELSILYDEIVIAKDVKNINPKPISELMHLYHTIIAKYENHLDLDYLKFQLTAPKDFTRSFWDRLSIKTRYFLHIYSLIIIPGLAMLFIIAFFYFIK